MAATSLVDSSVMDGGLVRAKFSSSLFMGARSNGERVNVVGPSFDSRHLVGTLEIAESRGASNGFLGVASRPRAVSADPCHPQ